ncbi:MAG: hypothetical protein FJW29_00175 [Acidobacteria bacterium]|nr:hypothetical protein [Acidobacteriota bacterium]
MACGGALMDARQAEIRRRAADDLRTHQVVLQGHFDYGNGFHGPLYLNPHQLFRSPSVIWRVAQDLMDVTPWDMLEQADVVAGPSTGGALLAHTIAGLLDGRRPMARARCEFAPFSTHEGTLQLSPFYASLIRGRRVVLADDVLNTGQTMARCVELVRQAGGTALAILHIIDRCESQVALPEPRVSLIEYTAPPNVAARECPMCASGIPITQF